MIKPEKQILQKCKLKTAIQTHPTTVKVDRRLCWAKTILFVSKGFQGHLFRTTKNKIKNEGKPRNSSLKICFNNNLVRQMCSSVVLRGLEECILEAVLLVIQLPIATLQSHSGRAPQCPISQAELASVCNHTLDSIAVADVFRTAFHNSQCYAMKCILRFTTWSTFSRVTEKANELCIDYILRTRET